MTKQNRLYIPVLLILIAHILPLPSCKDDKATAPDPKISVVSDNPQQVEKEGGIIEIKISSNTKWEITSNSDWVSFQDITEGENNASITVVVDENKGYEDRTAIVTINAATVQATVEIIQSAHKISFKSPSILFTKEELIALKEAVDEASSGSLRTAFGHLVSRCNTGLRHTSVINQGKDAFTFLEDIAIPSTFARDLALGYHLTGEAEYAQKSLEILNTWAVGCKDIQYDMSPQAPSTSMYLARSVFPMMCAYDLLKDTDQLTDEVNSNIKAWFESLFPQIKEGVKLWHDNDYFNKQEYQNHLVAHVMGILALGYILEDEAAIRFALNSSENPRDFYELIEGSIFMEGDTPHHREPANSPLPETGEIYDRYRHHTAGGKGLQYSHLTLSLLATTARICHNNGLDMFAYTAPSGENIGLSFNYYLDFYRSVNSCIKTGFYCGEDDRIGKAGDHPGLFEIGMRYYPDYENIKDLVYSGAYNRGTNYSTLHGLYRFYSVPVDPAD